MRGHLVATVAFLSVMSTTALAGAAPAMVCAPNASPLETLAAREVRRYVYQRTGELLPSPTARRPARLPGNSIVIGRKDRDHVAAVLHDQPVRTAVAALQAQQFLLKTILIEGRRVLLVLGGDDVGTLYGAYRLAECLGVRFYLHGDVIPDEPIRFELPNLDEQGKPLFGLRGIQPFNNFPFGPDWWTMEDYKAHIAQLAKMRMNFIGFHCYPQYYGRTEPLEPRGLLEPTVWMGLKGDSDEQGRVRVGYPTRQSHTMEKPAQGGFSVPMKTGDYRFGAALLFDRDDAGSEAMAVAASRPNAADANNAVFEYCGALYREVFSLARALGVKTCIGTEVPSRQTRYVMPAALLERIRAQKKDPADPAVVREVYEAMFQRIMKTHPLDYFWLWTSECWRERNTPEELKVAVEHFTAAHEALRSVGAPFKLATAGWLLGPQEDRAAYDQLLPKDVALSSIDTDLGHAPVEPAYARVRGREKWAIPWMEDDLALANPQLWVGRTRKDAADALAYGCTGLMGIHWRTRIIAPSFAALAQAAWNQSPWNPQPGEVPPSVALGLPYGNEPLTPRTMYMDWPRPPRPNMLHAPRGLSTADFYADWARANFGREAAGEVAAIFERIDGNLPRVLNGCPCGLKPDNRPWNHVAEEYGFVDALQACRGKVKGAGNLDRFDYWIDSLRYLRASGAMECALGQFNQQMGKVNAEQDPAKRREPAKTSALPAYREVFMRYREALGLLLQTTGSAGELGTVAVWQQVYYPAAIGKPGATLAGALGQPLPADLQPTKDYQGPPRLIVPTLRGIAGKGERLPVRVIILSENPPRKPKLHWRVLGTGEFAAVDLRHVARGVYSVVLPPMPEAGLEYYIRAATDDRRQLVFPPTAPRLNQTVVALPRGNDCSEPPPQAAFDAGGSR
ncbi:MAG: hypothetical protein HY674_15710 [Chloroflexi bacterium]|nr:hypothetical protein [Chloroflexota bacterium]